MNRDYETPEDYQGADHAAWDDSDQHADRMAEAEREEAALRRWEARREAGPYEDQPEDDEREHAAWLRREEYGDQDEGTVAA